MPSSNVPLVADMSSDILSRTFDAEPFALIYGGVQKNMGPAGAVMYAVDTERFGAKRPRHPSYSTSTCTSAKTACSTRLLSSLCTPPCSRCAG